MIFESHAHYEDARFDEDREALLSSFPQKGIDYVVNVGSSLKTTQQSIALAKQYDLCGRRGTPGGDSRIERRKFCMALRADETGKGGSSRRDWLGLSLG